MINEHTPKSIMAAARVVDELAKLLADPMLGQRVRLLESRVRDVVERTQVEPEFDEEKAAKRGTCPTCGREYGIKKNGALRRHRDVNYGREKCQYDDQLPAELLPAILVIARLGESGKTQNAGSHVPDHF